MKNLHLLQAIIDHFGSPRALADALNIQSENTFTHWKIRGIPAKRAMQIDYLTQGKFPAVALVEEIFDEIK